MNTDQHEHKLPHMKVLVTGASGFLGSHIVDVFTEAGFDVRAMVRRSSNLRWLKGKKVEIVFASLEDRGSLTRACAQVEAVVHAAGAIKAARESDFSRINTKGTRNLLQACISRNSPPLFICVSSAGAQGPSRSSEPLRESDTPRPVTAYGRSKLAAERLVLEASGSVPVVVLRPGGIFGPRDSEFLPLFRMAAFSPVIFGSGLRVRRVCVTHARDVARCILLAVRQSQARGKVFLVGGHNTTQRRLLSEIAAAVGKNPLVLAAPSPLIRFAGLLSSAGARLTGKPRLFTFDNCRRLLARNWWIDDTLARDILGYRAEIPLKEGLEECARWYRREGFL